MSAARMMSCTAGVRTYRPPVTSGRSLQTLSPGRMQHVMLGTPGIQLRSWTGEAVCDATRLGHVHSALTCELL